MKRKGFFIVGGIVIAIAITFMLVFVFSGNDKKTDNTSIQMDGTWKVVTYVNNGEVSIVENEFMVFDNETANDYRDGNDIPYASSKYVLENNELILQDISRKYIVDQKTANYICLYEKKDVYMALIRYRNADMTDVETTKKQRIEYVKNNLRNAFNQLSRTGLSEAEILQLIRKGSKNSPQIE